MPKHALSFKHLIGSATAQRKEEKKERSVAELLSSSRQSQVREPAPHVSPQVIQHGPDGASIHPAELLRREQQAHYRAARSVAGPAPPRSWRPREKAETGAKAASSEAQLSAEALEAAARFLKSPRLGQSLLGTCVQLTLRLLRDKTVVSDEEETVTLADAVLAGACQLEGHLRGLLISMASVSGARLSDKQVRALLEFDDKSMADDPSRVREAVEPGEPDTSSEESDWDAATTEPLAHLPLALHPNPIPLLRDAPHARLLALTSLDLAFATIPDLDRLVAALPVRLRALGLAGVRSTTGYESWSRGLTLMARKLIVLQTLDISSFPIPVTTVLTSLFQAPARHLPSLRTLGMRETPQSQQKDIRAMVNRGRGGRWVDVVF